MGNWFSSHPPAAQPGAADSPRAAGAGAAAPPQLVYDNLQTLIVQEQASGRRLQFPAVDHFGCSYDPTDLEWRHNSVNRRAPVQLYHVGNTAYNFIREHGSAAERTRHDARLDASAWTGRGSVDVLATGHWDEAHLNRYATRTANTIVAVKRVALQIDIADDLKQAMARLRYQPNEWQQMEWDNFFQDWGTHLATSMVLGGQRTISFYTNQGERRADNSQTLDILGVLPSLGFVDASYSRTRIEHIHRTATRITVNWAGGDEQYHVDNLDDILRTDKLWKQSAPQHLAVLYYELTELWHFFAPERRAYAKSRYEAFRTRVEQSQNAQIQARQTTGGVYFHNASDKPVGVCLSFWGPWYYDFQAQIPPGSHYLMTGPLWGVAYSLNYWIVNERTPAAHSKELKSCYTLKHRTTPCHGHGKKVLMQNMGDDISVHVMDRGTRLAMGAAVA